MTDLSSDHSCREDHSCRDNYDQFSEGDIAWAERVVAERLR